MRMLVLMAIEDKASPGMGSGEAVDLDHPMIQGAVETPDVPEATQKAVRQVFTQVLLSTGELGLLTALKNGTWVYGLQKTGLVFSIDFTAAAICSSILRRPNVMYKTTNLTPKGIDPFQQLEVILEAEVLCFLHAVQVQHPYSFPPGLQEVLDAFGVVRSALGDLSADDNILPNVCAQPSWKEGSCLFKAGLFLWMLLSVLILQIAGPSLLRTGRVCLYLWSSDHAVRTDHGVHRLYRWPRSDHWCRWVLRYSPIMMSYQPANPSSPEDRSRTWKRRTWYGQTSGGHKHRCQNRTHRYN